VVLLTLVHEGEDTPLPLYGEAEVRDPVGNPILREGGTWHEKEQHVECHGY